MIRRDNKLENMSETIIFFFHEKINVLFWHIYIYIYIVCVCVCVVQLTAHWLSNQRDL
jgi:hypothetical protein